VNVRSLVQTNWARHRAASLRIPSFDSGVKLLGCYSRARASHGGGRLGGGSATAVRGSAAVTGIPTATFRNAIPAGVILYDGIRGAT